MHQGFARGLSLTRLWFKDVRELCWGFVCTRDSHVVVFSQDLCMRESHKSCVCTRALQMGVAWRLCLHEGEGESHEAGAGTRALHWRPYVRLLHKDCVFTRAVFAQGLCSRAFCVGLLHVDCVLTRAVVAGGFCTRATFAPGSRSKLAFARGLCAGLCLHEGFLKQESDTGCARTRALHEAFACARLCSQGCLCAVLSACACTTAFMV